MARPEFRLTDTVAFNVLHYQLTHVTDAGTGLPSATAVPFEDVCEAIATAFQNRFSGSWKFLASQSVTMTSTSVQVIHPAPRSILWTHAPNAPVNGIITSEALPLQDSATLVKRSAFGERWGIGRTFVVGLPESSQDNGLLNAGAIAAINAYGEDLRVPLDVTSAGYLMRFQPVLFSKFPGLQPRITPIIDVELSNPVLKTQRRRRPGKGM